jgi:AGZA family xanthine/uracil permease-like MFS transporter
MSDRDVDMSVVEEILNDNEELGSNEVGGNNEANIDSEVVVSSGIEVKPNRLDRFFEISKRGSKLSTEFFGGLTTFLSMAFILSANPNLLSLPLTKLYSSEVVSWIWDSIFIATCFLSSISTLVMAFLPNMPFALAPGMGLNAQVMSYIYGDVGPSYTFAASMTVVFVAGVLFMIITLTGLREFFFDGIPQSVKSAIPIGIGLFISFVGLQNGLYIYI